jgi:hypothetical protein
MAPAVVSPRSFVPVRQMDGVIPWRQIRALEPQPDMDLVGRRVYQARRQDIAMSLTWHLAAGAVHTTG